MIRPTVADMVIQSAKGKRHVTDMGLALVDAAIESAMNPRAIEADAGRKAAASAMRNMAPKKGSK